MAVDPSSANHGVSDVSGTAHGTGKVTVDGSVKIHFAETELQ
jgi:hypothetical protein